MLGYVRFHRGGLELIDASLDMNAALESGATNRIAYLVAAEAARLIGHRERAADILRTGLDVYPHDLAMLNNLAFSLAEEGEAGQALNVLPELQRLGRGDPNVLDTIATIYLRAGMPKQGQTTAQAMIDAVDFGTPLWFRARLHLADAAMQQEEQQAARAILEELFRHTRDIPNTDIVTAMRLLAQCVADRPPAALDKVEASP